jgi:citrate synthase
MNDVADWWQTDIIDMAPGQIRLRGTPIEDLIGTIGFAEMVWLMTRGERPNRAQAALFEAALVSAVDHGPQAPSIAAARMAVSCGLPLNNAMATAINMLGDVHGGAGEQAMQFFHEVRDATVGSAGPEAAVELVYAAHGGFVPGFGHRFHKNGDPRAARLLALVAMAVDDGVCSGEFAGIAVAVETYLQKLKGRPIPMNVDGVTAVIYAELGFAPALARGLFCLSRSVGVLAHAHEQAGRKERNKGPTPPHYRWTYGGDNPIE